MVKLPEIRHMCPRITKAVTVTLTFLISLNIVSIVILNYSAEVVRMSIPIQLFIALFSGLLIGLLVKLMSVLANEMTSKLPKSKKLYAELLDMFDQKTLIYFYCNINHIHSKSMISEALDRRFPDWTVEYRKINHRAVSDREGIIKKFDAYHQLEKEVLKNPNPYFQEGKLTPYFWNIRPSSSELR